MEMECQRKRGFEDDMGWGFGWSTWKAEVPFLRLGRAWWCVGLEGSSGTRFWMC